MASAPELAALLARLPEMLAPFGVTDIAVTGGVAVSVWTEPRETRDVDVCALVPPESIARLLSRFDGVPAGVGEVPDVLRLSIGTWDIDVFPVKDAHDTACMQRASAADFSGVTIRVVSPEDLVVHKMIKLRSDKRRLLQDAADIRALLAARAGQFDHAYVKTWLPTAESALIAEAGSLDDSTLVRRLGG